MIRSVINITCFVVLLNACSHNKYTACVYDRETLKAIDSVFVTSSTEAARIWLEQGILPDVIDLYTFTDSSGCFSAEGEKDDYKEYLFVKKGYRFEIRGIHYPHPEKDSILLQPRAVKDEKTEKITSRSDLKWKHLEGNWILKEFTDNVLRDKTIGKHRSTPLATQAWAFTIDNDSLESAGLLYGFSVKYDERAGSKGDTLLHVETFGETFTFIYDIKTDRIIAYNTTAGHAKEKYSYRRATGRLNKILAYTPFNYQTGDSMYHFLTDSLIVGKYNPSANYAGIGTVIFRKGGSVSGFRNFDTYFIHDYFGTLHPFGDHDALIFERSDSETGEVYNWKFRGKKLTLTKMHTDTGGDSYYLGTEKYEFIKSE